MEFELPQIKGFTIYSKSGCPNCTKVKQLLKQESSPFIVVDCDEYLLEARELFLLFIQQIAGKSYAQFPMVFHDGDFIGGFKETQEFLKENLTFDE
jgi:glutaredoxin